MSASKKISDFCLVTSSKRIFASEYEESGVPFYRSKEVIERQSGKLEVTTEIFISEIRFEEIERKFGVPQEDDLLLTSVGTLGIPYIVNKNERFYFKDGNLTWFRKFNGLSSRYLYYWFLSPIGKGELKKATIGSSQSAYTINLLNNLSINPPEFDLQLRVVNLLSNYDNLIEINIRSIALLEELVRLLYREWFINLRFLGHQTNDKSIVLPKGWVRKPLADLIETSPKIAYEKDKLYPYVPMQSVSESSMVIGTREERIISGGTKFQNFDTLLARITPCLENGKTAFVQFLDEETPVASGSTEFIVMRSKTVNPYWVYCLAREDSFREHAIRSMAGADGRQRVNPKCFETYMTYQPPEKILKDFQELVAPVFEQVETLANQNKILMAARDELIPKLMSGAIQV